MNDQFLVKIDRATRLLAACQSAKEVKGMADMAAAAKVWARRTKASAKHRNFATAFELRCERRLGEILAKMPKAVGGQPYHSKNSTHTIQERVETLKDTGLSLKEGAHAKRLAGLNGDHFDAVVAQLEATEDIEIPKARVVEILQKPKDQYTILADANAKRPVPFMDVAMLTEVIDATRQLQKASIDRVACYLKETALGQEHLRDGHLDLLAEFWPVFTKKLKAKVI